MIAAILILFGLAFEVVGAVTLTWGLLSTNMARIRQEKGREMNLPGWQRWLAGKVGSTDPRDAEPYGSEDYSKALYGVLALVIGFFLQGIATWLSLKRCI